MGKIKLLDKQVSEMIAAGEVVERPASAVKELMENAIDAQASAVTVEIKSGGISYIRITDNGSGIPAEDVPAAFLRHSTSKISTADDLEAIGTLGFRGEALNSIAAVSKLEMMTKTGEELGGTYIKLKGGDIVSQGDVGCPKGTTIIIRDLFYNTPARMKFLRKDVSEANAVYAAVERIALSHPEISVRFIRDGREDMLTPGDSKLLSAVYSVLGRQFADSLLPVEYELGGIAVSGFVSRPTACRANRNMQFFFLNGRNIKSRTVMAALEEAYKNSMMTGKFPCCVLKLRMDFGLVDVNVHPAKTEVRFASDRSVFDAVYYAVKSCLGQEDKRPELRLPRPQPQPEQAALGGEEPAEQMDFRVAKTPGAAPEAQGREKFRQEEAGGYALRSTAAAAYSPVQNPGHAQEDWGVSGRLSPMPSGQGAAVGEGGLPTGSAASAADGREEREASPREALRRGAHTQLRIIGECFNTYLLAESRDEIWMIDKHAAHERILYEELKAKGESAAQLLLNPVTVSLSPEEYDAVLQNIDVLKEAGFAAEAFGGTTVIIREAPMLLPGGHIAATLQEIAGYLAQHKKDATPERIDWLYHSVACRAAVKGGEKSSMMELEHLARRIVEFDDIRYCPHGRPVAFILTRRDLEKQFGRA